MQTGSAEDPPRRRLSAGHYVGLQIFAIVLPPAVLLLCKRPDRSLRRDIHRNLMLLLLLWIPAIVHASIYLHDAWSLGLGSQPRYFQPQPEALRLSPNSKHVSTAKENACATVFEGPDTLFGAQAAGCSPRSEKGDSAGLPEDRASHDASADMGTLPSLPHDHASRPQSTSSLSLSSIASSVSSTFTYMYEARTIARYRGHATSCPLCRKCSKCSKTHVQHFEHLKEYPSPPYESTTTDHSRQKHIAEKHHVSRCLCRCCTGKGPPSGRGNHVEGCVCDLCHRPGLSRVPRDRYRWKDGREVNASVGIPGPMMGGMGMGMGMGMGQGPEMVGI